MKNLKSLYTCAKNKNILSSQLNTVRAEGILEPCFDDDSGFRYRLVNSDAVILIQAPEYLSATMRRFLWELVSVKGFMSETEVLEIFKITPKRRTNNRDHSIFEENETSWSPITEKSRWPILDEPA